MLRRRLDELTVAPYNPRRISDAALDGLSASIARFGLVQPIIVNERTGRVVGGHQRIKALLQQGHEETDVLLVDLPEMEEKALNLALNSPEISGEFIRADLDTMLLELKEKESVLFEDLRLRELASPGFFDVDGETDEDSVPEVPAVPVSVRGRVYVLGRHRVMCGDATDTREVGMLLDGAKPFLMVTDPPYGVNYDPQWRAEHGWGNDKTGTVPSDDVVEWPEVYRLFGGSVAYVWHAGIHGSAVASNLADCGFEIRAQIVWVKQNSVFGRGAYHWQHEPCWYAVRKGKTAQWGGDRTQTTAWQIQNANPMGGQKDDGVTFHGTQKPVECMARPIRNHEAPEVYDPFLGSGTTLIAAEKLDRTCYGMEIAPIYVDVIRRRWAEFVHGEGCDWKMCTPEVEK